MTLAASRWARARWLVLAPHADDETLGAGALIAETAAAGRLAGVVYLTDGAGSHRCVDVRDRGRLVRARRREAGLALRRLGGPAAPAPIFLDWPDAHPHPPGSRAHDRARRRLTALCRHRRVDALAVTAAGEPHCDHAAFATLARAAAATARRPVALFEYAVWSEASRDADILTTATMPQGRRRHALGAHRSQLTALFGDGFRLPRERMRMPAADRLVRRRIRDAA